MLAVTGLQSEPSDGSRTWTELCSAVPICSAMSFCRKYIKNLVDTLNDTYKHFTGIEPQKQLKHI